jgi:hypothetical protein
MTMTATFPLDALAEPQFRDAKEATWEEIDRQLGQGFESGDWGAVRSALRAAPKEAAAYEGYHLGLALAAFHADADTAAAEQALAAALNRPASLWRPDVYRLQAIVLHAVGLDELARRAVANGLAAVERLSVDDTTKAGYRSWLELALPASTGELAPLPELKGEKLLDAWLSEASVSGDWRLCLERVRERFGGRLDLEAFCYARGAAAYHADSNTIAAEKWCCAALDAPESKWRPDVYRLLGVLLKERGDLETAESKLDAALDAVSRMSIPDDERARYADWIEAVLQPVRSELLQKDRVGIKSVLRNGILSGERTDKIECREALIALKSDEGTWTPDFISALLQALGTSNFGFVGRALALVGRLLRIAVLAALWAAILYGALHVPKMMCANSRDTWCYALTNSPLGPVMDASEHFGAAAASNLPLTPADILGEAETILVAALLIACILVAAGPLVRALLIRVTTKYILNDGRLTTEHHLLRRSRKNYEMLHASAFEINQAPVQWLLGRAQLSFFIVAVGGNGAEQVDIIGRRTELLAIEKHIRGMGRTMRSLARLKGIVAVE